MKLFAGRSTSFFVTRAWRCWRSLSRRQARSFARGLERDVFAVGKRRTFSSFLPVAGGKTMRISLWLGQRRRRRERRRGGEERKKEKRREEEEGGLSSLFCSLGLLDCSAFSIYMLQPLPVTCLPWVGECALVLDICATCLVHLHSTLPLLPHTHPTPAYYIPCHHMLPTCLPCLLPFYLLLPTMPFLFGFGKV